ncbi:bifunctional 4-hydroxy-2-oxoglutarate aldolase/2-dehydro-3-deoxy-phosphogluconate aldolase [Rhabdaerophilum sp. SD176]|uniref:bifunctional 4-hydroxy-2-oxoglutarate aldolase/2-dehydro-3-deoxy-phosphogluconate aldolase n=1 Tax=Rhabdaerophilum sp. SD176 TaxID=2983548 RepID=UPI0024DF6379|nr:bifunctional 4-hydroxy-2-oxoglutarate aldolase/2-dehydro-3-deoxy-phosphogluconate aldolase [Rhabdaerophilum sp. SD176]
MTVLPRFSPLLGKARVIPVITLDRVEDAVPLARALQAGGIDVVEVTLRTDAALRGCETIARECPDLVLGIGTVLTPSQIGEARDAGARFLVTPGTSEKLGHAVAESGIPCLPGAATVSEMVALMEMGFHELKFFPAEAAGGVDYLKSVAGPLGDLRFCPTGGISPANAGTYLALGNVLCIGGSWMVPKAAIAAGHWDEITALARAAAALGQ